MNISWKKLNIYSKSWNVLSLVYLMTFYNLQNSVKLCHKMQEIAFQFSGTLDLKILPGHGLDPPRCFSHLRCSACLSLPVFSPWCRHCMSWIKFSAPHRKFILARVFENIWRHHWSKWNKKVNKKKHLVFFKLFIDIHGKISVNKNVIHAERWYVLIPKTQGEYFIEH